MNLIAIIESGSTKSDWVFLNVDGVEQFRTKTSGLNPLVLGQEEMHNSLLENKTIHEIAHSVSCIYFYGAGVKVKSSKDALKSVFNSVFPKAVANIDSDLTAACYAAYQEKPCMVGILGTGSNSCFFDGEEVVKKTPSLGYVLGDEGSGNHIGRLVLIAYHNLAMPEDLRINFKEKFNVSVEELIQRVYKKPKPNAYLASFSTFAFENKEHEFIKGLILQSFDAFLVNQILPYKECQNAEINFIGSIAYHYQDFLKETVQCRNLEFGSVIQRPVEQLISYHKKIGLPQ